MKKLLLLILIPVCSYGQNMDSLFAIAEYPVIKGNPFSGVMPVPMVDESPDPTLQYNIIVDATGHSEDSTKVNWVLGNIGRIYNLHVAAGIPQENVHIVAAVHAFAGDSFLKNDAYHQKYSTDNPNLALIEELTGSGVKFLICAQSLYFQGSTREDLIDGAMLTLTAQTTLTSYQLKGYALLSMHDD